ncbi:DUF2332 domain-containing protein [Kribbella kalugense]|uniref:DUF2332 family protein n=1 Tax=Kribbella kalugense TaxID=2512221 RepID=A0A4R7ZYB1_9ACTN|nr:DUF2332 domain-containing protein [Kribbella kalugense]TDW23183.1 hypothetical protein EV650_2034 [Kribbella kalugense]
MSRPTTGPAHEAAKTARPGSDRSAASRTLAQKYRRFAEVEATKTSPLDERIALAISESDEALAAIETAPARKRHPALILAALHDLALTDHAPALATAYATASQPGHTAPTATPAPNPDEAPGPEPDAPPGLEPDAPPGLEPVAAAGLESVAAAGLRRPAGSGASESGVGLGADADLAAVAVDTLVRMTEAVVSIAVRRKVRANEVGHHAVLYPAISEVARRVGANTVGLIDVGCSAGLNLNVDRVGITYGNGQSLGDPSSAVQVSASIVGDRPVPALTVPEVVARIGIDLDPIDVTDADEARWLRACLPPDQPERIARLEAELTLAATNPPLLLQGDAIELLPDALARVPADALPVVTTTWALSDLPLESRLRFLQLLDEAATDRPVAWVSVEGVGVAPSIPTFGDRRASGHSIIGLAVFDHSSLHAEAVGRCWLRGQMLAWLADS